ncbi:MAG: ABC transporter substrate-binding protein [Actinobacteria bacterium]|nr:ABC transporter substrate-binding protein [Actinomycetota bacterium]
MRIKSRGLAILLALGLVLAACSPAETESTTTTEGDAPVTTAGDGATTTTGDMAIATDIGVDLEAGTISIGLLSDLTGPFSSLVQVIVTGHEVYWENVNANGGVGGLQVELDVVDTAYDIPTHVQRYDELRETVAAFGHSTGSPHTVALVINEDGTPGRLVEDGILAIPLTWYSGWYDPTYNSNLVGHGTPYCIESMNVLSFIKEQLGDAATTVAIASMGGDYGLDSHEGAKLAAEQLGLEVVYEGRGAVIVGDEASYATVATAIVEAEPDIVYVTATPAAWSAIFGQALAGGFTTGVWSGAAPSYNPAFIGAESQIRDAVAAATMWGSYYHTWGAEGTEDAIQLLMDSGRVEVPVSSYLEGFVEAQLLHAALQAAYDSGDMTRAGILAAAKSLESVSFGGLAPDQSYVGTPDEQLSRATTMWRPDPEALAAGESAGEEVLAADYVSDLAAAYEFTGACYQFGT